MADLMMMFGVPQAPASLARLVASVGFRDPAWSAGPHFVGLKVGLVLLAVVVMFRVRRRVLVRLRGLRWLRGLGWRRMAIACGAAAALFYVAWIFYLSGTMPSVTVAYNWNTAWLALDGFEGLTALLTAVLLFKDSTYAVLSAAAFSTSLCVDALFDVTTAAQGPPLVTAVLEAVLVELPFAALSAVLAVRLLAASPRQPRSPLG